MKNNTNRSRDGGESAHSAASFVYRYYIMAALFIALCVFYSVVLAGVHANGESGEDEVPEEVYTENLVRVQPVRGEIYDRKYALYKKTVACLDGLWDEMQKLVDRKF